MSIVKKSISVILCIVLVLGSAFVIASADGSYRDNARWTEITKSEADSRYNSGEKFIVVFFRNDCTNCQSVGNNVLTTWMDTYSYNIYGVNADVNGISDWVITKLKTTAVTLPAVLSSSRCSPPAGRRRPAPICRRAAPRPGTARQARRLPDHP